MDIMGKVQDQYGCTDLAAPEMNPHCLTVLTLDTTLSMTIIIISSISLIGAIIIIISIITIISCMALITMLSLLTTICVTTTTMLQFIVQVNSDVIVQIKMPCTYL